MDALQAVPATLWSSALESAASLRTSVRALTDWAIDITSRQANLVAILGQSLTLCLLSIVITYVRKRETDRRSQRLRAPGA